MEFTFYNTPSYTLNKNTKGQWIDYIVKEESRPHKCANMDIIEKSLQNEKFVHARLTSNTNYKLYGDLDQLKVNIVDALEHIRQAYEKVLNIKITKISYTTNDNYKLANEGMTSHHYVFPEYYASIEEQSSIKEKINEEVKQYDIEIDKSVYCDRWFRMPNQKKGRIPNKEPDLGIHRIISGRMADFVMDYISDAKKVNITIEDKRQHIVKDKKQTNNEPIEIPQVENIEYIKELINCLDATKYEHYEDWLQLSILFRNIGAYEHFIKFAHTSPKFTQYENDFNRVFSKSPKNYNLTIATLIMYAKRDNPSKLKEIIKRYNTLHFDDIFNDIYLHDNKPDYTENTQRISTKAIAQIVKQNTIICFASTGCGKSTMIKKNYVEKYPKKSILSVSAIRSLCMQQKTDWNLQSYLECDKKADLSNRAIISLEQICSVKDTYDILILDEITSLLEHIFSPTIKSKRQCYEKLITLIRNSKTVICCDAIITDIVVNFIKSIRGSVFFYENSFKRWSKVNIKHSIVNKVGQLSYNKVEEWITPKIKDKLLNRERCVIMSDSKKFVKIAYDICCSICDKNNIDTTDYIKQFTSENGKLSNMNTEYFSDKVILYSPKIVFGVNIDNLEYGNNQIFALFKGGSINSLAMLQQIGRIRQVEGTINVLWVNGKNTKNNKFIDENKFNANIKKTYENDISKIKSFSDKIATFDVLGKIDDAPIFLQHYNKSMWYDYITSNDKYEILNALLTHYGYTIETEIIETVKVGGKRIKNTNDAQLLAFVEGKMNEDDDAYDTISEIIMNRKRYLNITKMTQELKDIICNNKIYNECLKSKCLFNPPKHYKKVDLFNVDNVLQYEGLNMISNIEKMGEFNRFEVDNIKNEDKIYEYLRDNNEDVEKLVFGANKNLTQRHKSTEEFLEKLEKVGIKYVVCELYNIYGSFFVLKRQGRSQKKVFAKDNEFYKLLMIFRNQLYFGTPNVNTNSAYDGILNDEVESTDMLLIR